MSKTTRETDILLEAGNPSHPWYSALTHCLAVRPKDEKNQESGDDDEPDDSFWHDSTSTIRAKQTEDECKHMDIVHISYKVGGSRGLWMKCDCGEVWEGEIPNWVLFHMEDLDGDR